ncbi:uncharacterized protein [Drosophila takahashii]|uniref:uncharacterized protein n=1 Tax=Drosophila takahashii TaxID=29030 RepID=UPI001CF8BC42|nr:uncharacterized protein LOC108059823 [Drosophila takahashii]
MFLSRKEIVSLLLLLTAIISVLNASVFANILPLHVSYEQLAHQVVCVGTAYICLIYAFSTWLYHSNYSRTRFHMRMVLVTMIVFTVLFNCITTYLFYKKVSFARLEESMNLFLLFSKFSVASKSVSLGISVVTVLLLFLIMVVVIVTMVQSRRRHNREDKHGSIESQELKK